MSASARLAELGVPLPQRVAPLASYVPAVRTGGSSETVPGLDLPVQAFGSPAMATVEALLLLCPTNAAATSSQQRWVIVADHHGLIAASLGQAEQ